MDSNVLRWNFHPTTDTNPSALTLLIEGKPLSVFLGYRVANYVHLFYRDFCSFFKCILSMKYLGINYGDTRKYVRRFLLSENLCMLKFEANTAYSPIMCIQNDNVYYLTESISNEEPSISKIKIEKHPSLALFVEKMDINLIINFLKQYLGQSNLKIFGSMILLIVNDWTSKYKERDLSEEHLNFFLEIAPTPGDFFLFHSLIDYVHSLPQ